MPEQKRYPKAPITEAIIDIRIVAPENSDSSTRDNLFAIGGDLKLQYPNHEELHRHEVLVTIPGNVHTQDRFAGVRYISADLHTSLAAQPDGFTFSMRAPYSCWDEFCSLARSAWTIYKSKVRPASIVRVAVRYINKIDIPLPAEPTEDYFRLYPMIPEALGDVSESFFLQVRKPQLDLHANLVVTQGLAPPEKEGVVGVVLDIDLFRDADLPQTDDDVWKLFEQFRVRKNVAFEACIGDATRRLFA